MWEREERASTRWMRREITFDSFFPNPLSLFRDLDGLLSLPRPEMSSGTLVLDPGADLPYKMTQCSWYLVLIPLSNV